MRLSGTPGTLQPSMVTHTSVSLSLKCTKGDMLNEINLHTVFQLLEVDDLTGCLTSIENRALLEELMSFPLLQYKLRLLICFLRSRPTVEKLVSKAMALFHMDRNFR
jgi:hypothetical protein